MNSKILFNLILEHKYEQAEKAIHAILTQKINELMEEVKDDMAKTLFEEDEIELNEATAKRKIVVRNNRKKIIFKCRPGYKKKPGSRSCVRISSSKRIRMKRVARKAARKRRIKKTQITRKRNRSLRKRKALNL